jgi:hypothetical protein
MHSDGQVQSGRFVVDRIKIRIDEMLLVFEGPKTDSHRAVLLGAAHLFDCFGEGHRGDDTRPPQSVVALFPDFRHPAVP